MEIVYNLNQYLSPAGIVILLSCGFVSEIIDLF